MRDNQSPKCNEKQAEISFIREANMTLPFKICIFPAFTIKLNFANRQNQILTERRSDTLMHPRWSSSSYSHIPFLPLVNDQNTSKSILVTSIYQYDYGKKFNPNGPQFLMIPDKRLPCKVILCWRGLSLMQSDWFELLLLLWFTPGSVLSEEGTGLVGDWPPSAQ